MDYNSQWQQPPAPAIQPPEMNQSTAVDAYYASYYGYYANPNPSSISDLQTYESSAIAIPPPPGVVDSTAAVIATTSYVTVDTTPYYTLDMNAQQNSAWPGLTEQSHSIYPPDFSWTGHIVQAQLPGMKKGKVVRSAYCEVCKVDCNGPSVFEQHILGKKHLKNLRS
ncbi:unnamed protein product [Arabidopsis thaliana]|uniref:C2H2-type domain-containing protein n=1 Tax=Arabidopsis thaliana TaxID=3702 RepID=A0A5S9XGU8_ARATH|nr:unnamed protein product [Arabidopsis thaliana]